MITAAQHMELWSSVLFNNREDCGFGQGLYGSCRDPAKFRSKADVIFNHFTNVAAKDFTDHWENCSQITDMAYKNHKEMRNIWPPEYITEYNAI